MSERTRERRAFKGIELREADKPADGRIATLVGYAAVFNSLSEDLGGFRESIRPGAFKESLARGDDIRALFGHDSNAVIGRRSASTLSLTEDEKGLKVEVAIPDTSVGRDLVVSVKRGDITGMSFGFSVVKQDWAKVNRDGDVVYRRELIAVDLFEVSAVAWPAYVDTSVEARSKSDLEAILKEGRTLLGKDAQERRDRRIKLYKARRALWN